MQERRQGNLSDVSFWWATVKKEWEEGRRNGPVIPIREARRNGPVIPIREARRNGHVTPIRDVGMFGTGTEEPIQFTLVYRHCIGDGRRDNGRPMITNRPWTSKL